MRRRFVSWAAGTNGCSGALTVCGVCVALSVALSAGRLLPQADTVLEKLSVREADARKSFFDLGARRPTPRARLRPSG